MDRYIFSAYQEQLTVEANSYIKLAVEIHGTITVIHVQLQHTGRLFVQVDMVY